jgi:hypothetical protein
MPSALRGARASRAVRFGRRVVSVATVHAMATTANGSWTKLVGVLTWRAVRNPRTAAALLRVGWRFRSRDWYRHFPFLPLPDRQYLRWRMYTAYGDEHVVPPRTTSCGTRVGGTRAMIRPTRDVTRANDQSPGIRPGLRSRRDHHARTGRDVCRVRGLVGVGLRRRHGLSRARRGEARRHSTAGSRYDERHRRRNGLLWSRASRSRTRGTRAATTTTT